MINYNNANLVIRLVYIVQDHNQINVQLVIIPNITLKNQLINVFLVKLNNMETIPHNNVIIVVLNAEYVQDQQKMNVYNVQKIEKAPIASVR